MENTSNKLTVEFNSYENFMLAKKALEKDFTSHVDCILDGIQRIVFTKGIDRKLATSFLEELGLAYYTEFRYL